MNCRGRKSPENRRNEVEARRGCEKIEFRKVVGTLRVP